MFNRKLMQGYFRVRRRAWIVLAALTAVGGVAAQPAVRSIDVTYEGETYIVKAQVFAPVPVKTAWAVLTDFQNMAEWVPNVNDSRVVTPGVTQMTIEQRGTAKFGGLSFPYTSVREIVLDAPKTIRSTQVKGSMKQQKSLMNVSADGSGTLMRYRLEVVPSLLASAAISADFLKHEIDEQFTAIVGEMIKRKR